LILSKTATLFALADIAEKIDHKSNDKHLLVRFILTHCTAAIHLQQLISDI